MKIMIKTVFYFAFLYGAHVFAMNTLSADIPSTHSERSSVFSTSVILDNTTHRVDFYPVEIRANNYKVLSQVAGGQFEHVYPAATKQFIGKLLDNDKHVHMLLSVTNNTFKMSVLKGEQVSNFSAVAQSNKTQPLDWQKSTANNASFTTKQDAISVAQSAPVIKGVASRSNAANSCSVKEAELAIDCDYSCYEFYDKDNAKIAAMADNLLLKMSALYLRDFKLGFKLTTLLIRSSQEDDPYQNLPEQGDVLSKMVSDWESATDRGNYDLAALIHNRFNGAGIAYLSSVCSEFKYSVNSISTNAEDAFVVMRHEVGHNFGSNHYEGGSPEGRTIMSGNSINRISGPEVDAMLSTYDAQCLEDVPAPQTAIFPYAKFDSIQLQSTDPVTLNPLDNDYDANCEQLDFVGLSESNSLQGTATANAQGVISYQPPNSDTEDKIYYSITDSNGNTSEGLYKVVVDVDDTTNPAPPSSGGSGGSSYWLLGLLAVVFIFNTYRIK